MMCCSYWLQMLGAKSKLCIWQPNTFFSVTMWTKKIKILKLNIYSTKSDPLLKAPPPSLITVLCPKSHAALTPQIMLSRSEKYTVEQSKNSSSMWTNDFFLFTSYFMK